MVNGKRMVLAALLFAGTMVTLGTGCPPAGDDLAHLAVKGLLGSGCRGENIPRPGEEKTVLLPGNVPLVLVWVPAGSFQMGRSPGELLTGGNEDPQHPVTLSQGFWMGKYEITQRQWLAVRTVWPGPAPQQTYGLGDDYPAYNLAWNDARDFAAVLSAHLVTSGQDPLTMRLPSEAEWEYACRAGTQTRFYFGDSLDCAATCLDCDAGVSPGYRNTYMWYCGNNSPNGTKIVGLKMPNAFGLHDMSGNVWEWCEDDYHANYQGAPADGSAWVDTPRKGVRVARGGDWYRHSVYCRSAYRYERNFDHRSSTQGMRVVADL